jgi:Yip1 domain
VETSPVDSGPAAESAASPVGRVVGTFVSPGPTFASIARRPGWIAPLLLSTILSVVLSAVLLPRMDFEAAVRERLAEREETVSEERIEKIVSAQKRFAAFGYVWAALAPALVSLAVAGIFWLSFKAFGWELSYRQSFGVTTHAFLPTLFVSLLLIFFVGRRELVNPADLTDLVKSNPGFLVDRHANPVLHSLLQSIDVFSIWAFALLVLGFALAAKVTHGKAAAVIGTLWAVYVLGKAGLTAVFS